MTCIDQNWTTSNLLFPIRSYWTSLTKYTLTPSPLYSISVLNSLRNLEAISGHTRARARARTNTAYAFVDTCEAIGMMEESLVKRGRLN